MTNQNIYSDVFKDKRIIFPECISKYPMYLGFPMFFPRTDLTDGQILRIFFNECFIISYYLSTTHEETNENIIRSFRDMFCDLQSLSRTQIEKETKRLKENNMFNPNGIMRMLSENPNCIMTIGYIVAVHYFKNLQDMGFDVNHFLDEFLNYLNNDFKKIKWCIKK